MKKKAPAVEKANVLLPGLEQNAVSFAEEQLQQTYEDCYYVYYSVNDTLNEEVNFIFAQENNSAFVLTYYWNGIFRGFHKSQFSTYQEKYEDMKESVEMVENLNHKGKEIDIDIFFEKSGKLSSNMR